MRAAGIVAVVLLLPLPSHAETVRSKSGATAKVSPAHAAKFQSLINWLEGKGYRIRFMGGIRRGKCWPGGMHPCGAAIDINQTARGKVIGAFPPGTDAFARSIGLVSGAGWCNQDRGHFQVGGWEGCRHVKVKKTAPKTYAEAQGRD